VCRPQESLKEFEDGRESLRRDVQLAMESGEDAAAMLLRPAAAGAAKGAAAGVAAGAAADREKTPLEKAIDLTAKTKSSVRAACEAAKGNDALQTQRVLLVLRSFAPEALLLCVHATFERSFVTPQPDGALSPGVRLAGDLHKKFFLKEGSGSPLGFPLHPDANPALIAALGSAGAGLVARAAADAAPPRRAGAAAGAAGAAAAGPPWPCWLCLAPTLDAASGILSEVRAAYEQSEDARAAHVPGQRALPPPALPPALYWTLAGWAAYTQAKLPMLYVGNVYVRAARALARVCVCVCVCVCVLRAIFRTTFRYHLALVQHFLRSLEKGGAEGDLYVNGPAVEQLKVQLLFPLSSAAAIKSTGIKSSGALLFGPPGSGAMVAYIAVSQCNEHARYPRHCDPQEKRRSHARCSTALDFWWRFRARHRTSTRGGSARRRQRFGP
jgi:hypothetical protein